MKQRPSTIDHQVTMATSSNVSVTYEPASKHHDELLSVYVWPFALVVIYACVGTIGNVVVLYVYTYRWRRTKSRIFLIMLGVMNLINSAFNMPVEAYILWHPLQFEIHWLCKITRGITFVINNVCACVFVAIAIDRILLVYRPLRRQILTCRYAKISCLISFIVGFVTSWPGFVLYGTATVPEKLDNVVVIGKTCYLADEFLQKERWASTFNTILFVLMLVVFIILIILYTFIGRKLCRISLPVIYPQKDKTSKRLSTNRTLLRSIRTLLVKTAIPEQTLSDTVFSEPDNSNEHATINTAIRLNTTYNNNANNGSTFSQGRGSVTLLSYSHLSDSDVNANEGTTLSPSRNSVSFTPFESHLNESEIKLKEGTTFSPNRFSVPLMPGSHLSESDINENEVRDSGNMNGNEVQLREKVVPAAPARNKRPSVTISEPSIKPASPRQRSFPRMSRRISNVNCDAARDNTITMLMITVAYVLCFLPYLITVSLRYTHEDMPYHLPKSSRIAYHVFLRTYFLNSVINPLIYSFVNKTFRDIVVNMTKSCIKTRLGLAKE